MTHWSTDRNIVAGEMQTNINLSVLAGGCLPVWCLLSLFQDPSCSSKIRTHTQNRAWCDIGCQGFCAYCFFLIHDQKKLVDWGVVGSFFSFFLNKSFVFFFYYSVWLKAMCSHCEQREMGRQRGGGMREGAQTSGKTGRELQSQWDSSHRILIHPLFPLMAGACVQRCWAQLCTWQAPSMARTGTPRMARKARAHTRMHARTTEGAFVTHLLDFCLSVWCLLGVNERAENPL